MVIETFGVGSMWLDSLFTPFLFSLLNTVNGMGVSVVEKACFTWRVEEG